MDTVLDSSSLDIGWGVWADLHKFMKIIGSITILCFKKYHYKLKFVKVKPSIIEGTFICFHFFCNGSSNINYPEMCGKR